MFTKTILSIFLFGTFISFAQVGIDTNTPDAGSILDINSSSKGILIPRVALTATNSQSPITPAAIEGMMVYNIATAGSIPNIVTPGFYYWNGSVWNKFAIKPDENKFNSVTLNTDENITSSTFSTIPGMTLTFTASKSTALILLTVSGYGNTTEPLSWIEMRVYNQTTSSSYGGTQVNIHSSYRSGAESTNRIITSWSASFSKLITDLTVGTSYTFRVEARVFGQEGTTTSPIAYIYPAVLDIEASHLTLTVSQ